MADTMDSLDEDTVASLGFGNDPDVLAALERVRQRRAQETALRNQGSSVGNVLSDLGLGFGTALSHGNSADAITKQQEGRRSALNDRLKALRDQSSEEMGALKLVSAARDRSAAEKAKDTRQQAQFDQQSKLQTQRDQAAEDRANNREEKQPKPQQFQAAGFANRIGQAEKIFEDLASSGYDPTTTMSSAGRMLPEILKPEQLKMQEQAERNFVNAVLRNESGAAIAPSEFRSAERQYLQRPGDTPSVLAQKKANRMGVRAAYIAAAGPALERVNAQMPQLQGSSQSNYGADVLSYAQQHGISPDQAAAIKRQRTGQ